MKPKSIKTSIMVAALLAPGALFAQTTAKTGPVGYETVSLATGFNYIGLRLHQPTLAAGVLDAVSSSSITDNDVNIAALVTSGKTYIVEVKTTSPADSGAVAEVLGSAITNGVITTSNNLTAVGAAVGDTYSIRQSATIESVFGASNSANLTPGYGSSAGADVLYVPNGSGEFASYYYDGDESTWKTTGGTSVTPQDVPLVYLDAVVVFANNPLNLVVSGEVLRQSVIQAVGSGFNYIGGIHPAGATLDSTFSTNISTMTQGFGSSAGADVIYIPDGLGGFGSYYYDGDESVWKTTAGVNVTATDVNITSGLVYFSNSPYNLVNKKPTYYSSL
jgi:hypothetical protein